MTAEEFKAFTLHLQSPSGQEADGEERRVYRRCQGDRDKLDCSSKGERAWLVNNLCRGLEILEVHLTLRSERNLILGTADRDRSPSCLKFNPVHLFTSHF